ncbi:MAG: HAMP domain-containing histidine kinase [Deltaproteobacteria bacterium]|nr:HAMP domain-containing histidine kinase [Deltaproteobacteria bacterium]
MTLLNRHLTLQYKLNLFIYLGICILLLNFPVLYLGVTNVNQGIRHLELTEDLYNTILEMRRYEKNFLLYHDKESLESTKYYLNLAKEAFSKKLANFKKSAPKSEFTQLDKGLKEYSSLYILNKTEPQYSPKGTQRDIRAVGKQLVDAAESLLKVERHHIANEAKNALRWPLVFMGAMFLLFVTGARLIIRKVVRPLAKIEMATEKVALGDFSPISHADKDQSEVDHLVIAFNRMARELEAREEQIIHSRKVASLGTLVSGVAHELNNPINNIVLTVDSLVGKREISEQRRAVLLEDILAQALRASEIVKNLLEFSRAEISTYRELDLGTLLKETINIARNHMTLSKVQLHDEIADDLPTINGNHQGLQQVFLNLITNAVQAMPKGGDLTVRTSLEKENKIKVDVRDTGTGISEEDLPHIFDPFFTTKDVGKGTGLGLSVSYGIIKKHGGQITVKSKPGKGTTFTVVLPVYKGANN